MKGVTEKRFSGFPAGAEVTPVPNSFFTRVMPQIDEIAELKVLLHIFWVVSNRRGYQQFVTYNELVSDPVLMSSIKAGTSSGDEVLRRALGNAVQHGTIFHLVLERNGKLEDAYLINNEVGRKTIERIQQGKLPQLVLAPKKCEVVKAGPESDIFTLYEQNIGLLTPMIAEELQEAERLYPLEWIVSAFKEAVTLNKRSWKYISRILERWATEGKDDGKSGRDFKKENQRDKYVKGRYGHMVRR